MFQWNDLDGTAGSSRGLRGGYWDDLNVYDVSSNIRGTDSVLSDEFDSYGFRLASPV